MPPDAALVARLRAYSLMEAAQGDTPERAGSELVALEAEAQHHGWPEVAFLAAAGQVVHALVSRRDMVVIERALEALVARSQDLQAPALEGLALALRAVAAAGREDSAALLADAGRAVVLVEDDALPALDRCTVLVVSAAAYNTLSLWELVDELYDRATELAPACEQPLQEPAVAVDRVLIRLEWATALFEVGEEREALDQLHRAADAVRTALGVPMPPRLWQLDVRACRDVVAFVLHAYGEPVPGAPETFSVDERLAVLDDHREGLVAAGDVEVLPLLDALVTLSLVRSGRRSEALSRIGLRVPGSSLSGARSFPAWVRARVLSGDSADPALEAHREYGVLVSRMRWSARRGVLAAARSKIVGERLSAEHAELARDVLLDPLTGLSNRRCFDDWLAAVPDQDQATALLLIDLDNFKFVNDLHGHAVGDEALRRVARVLATHVRPGDMALRLGGDEFAVVFADRQESPGEDLDTLRRTAVHRAGVLREAVALTDWDRIAPGLSVRLSVGVAAATLGPGSPGAADRLYRQADAHLYQAKAELDATTG